MMWDCWGCNEDVERIFSWENNGALFWANQGQIKKRKSEEQKKESPSKAAKTGSKSWDEVFQDIELEYEIKTPYIPLNKGDLSEVADKVKLNAVVDLVPMEMWAEIICK